MRWMIVSLVLLFGGGAGASEAEAQGGDGSLRGTEKDDQRGALPRVTIAATSPALLGPGAAVPYAAGNYRVVNAPRCVYARRGTDGVCRLSPRGDLAARRR